MARFPNVLAGAENVPLWRRCPDCRSPNIREHDKYGIWMSCNQCAAYWHKPEKMKWEDFFEDRKT